MNMDVKIFTDHVGSRESYGSSSTDYVAKVKHSFEQAKLWPRAFAAIEKYEKAISNALSTTGDFSFVRGLILSLTLSLLVGCSGPVITNAVVQKDAPVSIPVAEPLTLNDVQWQVLTVAQLKTLLAQLQTAQQTNTIVFALDTPNYTNLQLNFVEIQRYIKEQKAILDMTKQILAERAGQPATPSKQTTGK